MVVDGIEVSIESSAAKANAELDKLIGKLGRVSTSIMSTNNNGSFTNLANGVQKLGNAMKSVSDVGLPSFNRLAKGISKLGEVDTASMQRTASAINQMSKSFSAIGGVNENAVQMGELAKNLAKFGNKSTVNAIDNIPKLATALEQLMITLSKAPTVNTNLIQMTNALANLASHGRAAGSASKSLSGGMNNFAMSAGRAQKKTVSLAAALGKFYATFWLLIRAGRKFKESIDISSDLTEVQNVVDTTFGKYSGLVEKMSESSIQDFGMSELTTKQISSRFQAMGSAMGFAQGRMADMSINLTKLAADMASFYNVEQEDVAQDLESVFTGQARPLRTYGMDLTEATLQEWAMRQGMQANINTMSQMEKSLLRYQYVMSNTAMAQGDFARTADTWANQTRILKQSFEQLQSVIGGALINAFKPLVKVLNMVLQKVIVFAEKVTEALGTIFGWKYESNTAGLAVDFDDIEGSTGGVADNLGEAAKNAKKLSIFAYDELNKRPDESTSGGGGASGGSGGGGGSSDGGGLVKVDSIFDKYKSEIDTLYKLGEAIGKTLTDAMNSIDWQKAYQGARDFGKGLADFLNGLISPELFGATGRTIAGALNTAIYAALSFGQTFDWKNLGESIAEGINEFFGTFDAKALAETINVWVQGIYTTVKTTIEDIEWKDVWDKAIEFLSNIDIETVEILLGAFALKYAGKVLTDKVFRDVVLGKLFGSTAMTKASEIVMNVSSKLLLVFASVGVAWAVFEGVIYDPLMDALNADLSKEQADKVKEEYRGLSGFGKLLKGIGQATKNGIDTGYFSVDGINAFNETLNSISFEGEIISDEKLKKMQEAFGYTEEQMFHLRTAMMEAHPELGILQSQFESLGTATPETLSQIAGAIDDVYGSVGGVDSAWLNEAMSQKDATDATKDFFEALESNESDFDKYESTVRDLGLVTEDTFGDAFVEKINDSLASVKASWKDFKTNISEKWDGVEVWFSENVAPWFTKEKWSNMFSNIKTSLATKWAEVVEWWKASGVFKWWTEDVSPWFTKEKWTGLYNNIKVALSDKWNEVVEWWKNSGAYKWYEENVKPLFSKEKWSFSGIKDGLSEMFDKAIESIKGSWNNFAKWLNAKLTFKIDTGNKIGQGISQLLGTSTIKLANLPTFATGGFPEDGLFRANSRELVGQFSNGKTAVVNNGQIIEGVAQGVRSAVIDGMMEVVMATSGNSSQSNNRPLQLVMDGRVVAETTYSQFETMSRQGLIPKFT